MPEMVSVEYSLSSCSQSVQVQHRSLLFRCLTICLSMGREALLKENAEDESGINESSFQVTGEDYM